MESTVLGYPRIGPQRELKKATEAYWAGRETAAGLEQTAAGLRRQTWETLRDAGLSDIPSNTFSLYDHVLDTAVMVNAVPKRFAGLEGLDAYFAMARGAEGITALELTKWFDTNYHYLVPELEQATDLRLVGDKPVREYLEARQLGIETRPVLLGPVSFLLLSKAVEPGFAPLDLLDPLLVAYEQLLGELHAAGARWVQLDEPALAADRTPAELEALRRAYQRLGSLRDRPKLLVSTYFGEIGDALAGAERAARSRRSAWTSWPGRGTGRHSARSAESARRRWSPASSTAGTCGARTCPPCCRSARRCSAWSES